MNRSLVTAALVSVVLSWGLTSTSAHAAEQEDHTFVCDNSGEGLSAVDVLRATGQHGQFLDYLNAYDPEGYKILTSPALSDKTIWAPTDEAFAKLGAAPDSATPDEIKAVLGFHITPPRRTPDGDYPIITFDYLSDGGQIVHQTRTGILTDSDQRVRTKEENGVFTVEGAQIGSTAWCTQAGSIFSIDTVITEVATPNWFERTLSMIIYVTLFQYPYMTGAFVLGALVLAGLLILVVRRARRHTS